MADYNKLISNLIVQDELRRRFIEEPDLVLADYNLSDKEIAEIKTINFKELEVEAAELDERLNKSFVRFWNLDDIFNDEGAYHSSSHDNVHASHADYGVPSGW